MNISSTVQSYSNVEEIRRALEDGEIDGALLDTYVAAEYKETLFSDKIFVKKILERPFGYGVVLSGAAVNVEQRCRDYIDLRISEIFRIIGNMTKTLDVSNFKVKSVTPLTAKIVPMKTLMSKRWHIKAKRPYLRSLLAS